MGKWVDDGVGGWRDGQVVCGQWLGWMPAGHVRQLRQTPFAHWGPMRGFPPSCGLFHLGLVVMEGSKQEKEG